MSLLLKKQTRSSLHYQDQDQQEVDKKDKAEQEQMEINYHGGAKGFYYMNSTAAGKYYDESHQLY